MTTRPPAEVGMLLEEVDTPARLGELDAFERNLKRMADAVAGTGARLRPDAKTHKCAVIARRQMALGAVGVCCQKVGEAEVMVEGGVDNALVSNEIVGRRKLDRLAALNRRAWVAVCVDEPANVDDLAAAAGSMPRELLSPVPALCYGSGQEATAMLGAIAGDIVGSIYEHANIKTKDFPLFGPGCRFTDDTVLSVAVADCLLNAGDFAQTLRAYTRAHPRRGFGGMFLQWALSDDLPAYGSWGNGSAMRVGPVGFAARNEDEALALAARSSAVSHDHPDAVAGAQAVALAIYLARRGRDRAAVRSEIAARFGYDLTESVAEIRARYTFDVSCAGTVPPALVCALAAEDFEDALRNAVSIGGDTDTVACIAGGLAEALHGLPEDIAAQARAYLTDDLEAVVARFHETYGAPART